MPVYKIHRLKDSRVEQFRWAPHASGAAQVRPKDYEEAGAIDAPTPYAAWFQLREKGRPLRVGDLLECETGKLHICKYVGFEEAHWVLPEAKSDADTSLSAAGPSEPQQRQS